MSIQDRFERDRYSKSMFECRANGVPTISFDMWQQGQNRLEEAFEELRNARNAQIERDRARLQVGKDAEDDVAAEEQMEAEFFNRKS